MRMWIVAPAFLVASAGLARAQHGDFVLFGEQPKERLDLADSQRAVHPLTAPHYHEDSFVTSDLRAWYAWHRIPESIALDGGDATAMALQIRVALTDSLQLVAYKDGILDLDTGLIDERGTNDLAAGLKWAFLQDWNSQLHAAVGAGYELATGDKDVLQDDSEIRLWASCNKGWDRFHLGVTANWIIENDSDEGLGDSDWASLHVHADWFVNKWFSPVVELNAYKTVDEGTEAVPFSGVDVANLGGGKGEDVVSCGIGFELRPTQRLALRAAWEFPLTSEEDLFGARATVSAIWSF
ncbi:MAG: hypothetical protein FJ293_04125 [Planctomycetes bacterium]|nr:hypothetical protein [Planctomycetota bacterium]